MNFPYSVKALQAVNEALIDFIPGPALYGFPDEPTGTLLQLPYSEWIQDPSNFGADAGLEALTRSFFRLLPSLPKKADVFRYRVMRASIYGQCGICYEWNETFPRSLHSYYQIARAEIEIFQPDAFRYLNWVRYFLPI